MVPQNVSIVSRIPWYYYPVLTIHIVSQVHHKILLQYITFCRMAYRKFVSVASIYLKICIDETCIKFKINMYLPSAIFSKAF